jgi:hypothetical protein
LTRKLSKYAPYDAPTIATIAIANFHILNKTIPQFISVSFLKLLVDGWCLQVRFGHTKAVCQLCLDGLDSMRHLSQ